MFLFSLFPPPPPPFIFSLIHCVACLPFPWKQEGGEDEMDFWVETPAEGNQSFQSLHILHHSSAPVPYPTFRFSSARSVHPGGGLHLLPCYRGAGARRFLPYHSVFYGGKEKEELHRWNLKSRPSPSSSPTSQSCPWGEVREDSRIQAAGFRPSSSSSPQSLGRCALLSGFTAGLQLSLHPLPPTCEASVSGF